MNEPLFRYRNRQLGIQDIRFIQEVISKEYLRGRSHIARTLCEAWQWVQPNGKLKEYAARDLLLRLEEKDFIALPPRLRTKVNRKKGYDQVPIFCQESLDGSIGQFDPPEMEVLDSRDGYLWDYLVQHYHYLGRPTLVGEHVRHLVRIRGQEVACLAWASAAWKVKSRDRSIYWLGRVHQAEKSVSVGQQHPLFDSRLGPDQTPGLQNSGAQSATAQRRLAKTL